MGNHKKITSGLVGIISTAALLSSALIGLGSEAATAAPVHTLPVADPFDAERCQGSTNDDPTDAGAPVDNLLSVFGQRLTDYNAGKVVVLYDAWGGNLPVNPVPPLCGVRFVAGVGPVSQWMFCTDIFFHACGGTSAAGELVDLDGAVIPGLNALPANPKLAPLDPDSSKLISYLLQNGHSYSGTGEYDFGETPATAGPTSTTAQRESLQALVWCISDPPTATVPQSAIDRRDTCDDNMSETEQARLLAMIPTTPTIQLSLAAGTTSLAIGDTARFTLNTNLYNQPIALALTGTGGSLSVISGPATLTGGVLTVTGTDTSATAQVVLGVTATSDGTANLRASASPVSINQLNWNQSPGVAEDGVPCQVFSHFDSRQNTVVANAATATFGTTGTAGVGGANELAVTGVDPTPALTLGTLLLALGGAALLAIRTRRTTRHSVGE
jgi:hypothetical protein